MAQNVQLHPVFPIIPPHLVLKRSAECESESEEPTPSHYFAPVSGPRHLLPSFVHKTVEYAIVALALVPFMIWDLLKAVFLPLALPSDSERSSPSSSQRDTHRTLYRSRRCHPGSEAARPYSRFVMVEENEIVNYWIGYTRTVFTRIVSMWVSYKSVILITERAKSLSESPSAVPSWGFVFDVVLIIGMGTVVLAVAAYSEQSERDMSLKPRSQARRGHGGQ